MRKKVWKIDMPISGFTSDFSVILYTVLYFQNVL